MIFFRKDVFVVNSDEKTAKPSVDNKVENFINFIEG